MVCFLPDLWCARLFSFYSSSHVHIHCPLLRHQEAILPPSQGQVHSALPYPTHLVPWNVCSLPHSNPGPGGRAQCDACWWSLSDKQHIFCHHWICRILLPSPGHHHHHVLPHRHPVEEAYHQCSCGKAPHQNTQCFRKGYNQPSKKTEWGIWLTPNTCSCYTTYQKVRVGLFLKADLINATPYNL